MKKVSAPCTPNGGSISKGDLVMVMRNCDCKITVGTGYVFRVERIESAWNWECRSCRRTRFDEGQPLAYGDAGLGAGYHPCAWLKRIPPLGELEGERTQEDIREPA